MKFSILAVMIAFSATAQADIFNPGRPNFNQISTLRCYVDSNHNGRVSKDEIRYFANPETQTIDATDSRIRYQVTSATVTKTPDGKPAAISIRGVAKNLVMAGGGTKSIKIDTDFLNRARWNSKIDIITSGFYNSGTDSQMMDCKL